MTVEENLDMGAYLRRPPRSRIASGYAEFPRLADRKKQAAGTLSGGEQQMLAIGRALIMAAWLYSDEPSLGLRPTSSRTFAIIRGIRDAGTTACWSNRTRLQHRMCDHAYLLEGSASFSPGLEPR